MEISILWGLGCVKGLWKFPLSLVSELKLTFYLFESYVTQKRSLLQLPFLKKGGTFRAACLFTTSCMQNSTNFREYISTYWLCGLAKGKVGF